METSSFATSLKIGEDLSLNSIDLQKLIRDAKSIAILSHIRPDGDTIGGALSMYEVCKNLGQNPVILCESKIPEYLSFVPNTNDYKQETYDKFELVFAIDCADLARVGNLQTIFEQANITVNIDHHQGNSNFAKYNLVERELSSTCQVLYGLYKRNNINISKQIAQYLYTGLSTDTGNFMHSTVSREVFLMAADLADIGVDIPFINRNLYQQSSRQRLKLIACALRKLEYHCLDRVTVIQINMTDLEECGISPSETEGIASYCINIKGVLVGSIMTQIEPTVYKVSFRSHPGVDVSLVANKFGGGGHKQAAGCLVTGTPQEAYEKVVRAMTDLIDCTV
ncbi:MAG: bifunctional oligoribonuclease/PAP phosphatase NrnA [Firmicutes bacterium]|nr:bifunctional oligoribonuclease/PAP phosphatase NrnA [Bacillota bacterium]MCL1954209.1 bifunctional oligoribonuclease/PAP phosphatase NrnA [Bacillota bacterium]